MVSFKGVFLEGLEIVFIVITFGLNADSIGLAVLGAAIGGVIVLAAGFALHKPLARVPENTIKFVVGLLLSTFGTFWAVEGLGWFAPDDASLHWPGGDLALLVLLALWCAPGAGDGQAPVPARARGRVVRFATGFLRFWWDFVVGDDWRIAAGVVVVLGAGALLVAQTGAPDGLVAVLTALGILLVAIGSIAASALGRAGADA